MGIGLEVGGGTRSPKSYIIGDGNRRMKYKTGKKGSGQRKRREATRYFNGPNAVDKKRCLDRMMPAAT